MPRFVITETDAQGRSTARVEDHASTPGHSAVLIWATDGSPARWDEPGDHETWRSFGTPPPAGGSKLVHLTIPADHRGVVHQTDTVDYAIVTRGSIVAVLDANSVPLTVGDVLVQRGTVHAWSNVSGEPAELVVALLDAQPRRPDSLRPGERPADRPVVRPL